MQTVHTSSVVGDCFGQHGLATAGRAVHEHTAGRVNADLLVQFKVSERQLHGLPHLLLLDVHASNVSIGHVRLLICQGGKPYA